jgi:hypothetical protein
VAFLHCDEFGSVEEKYWFVSSEIERGLAKTVSRYYNPEVGSNMVHYAR